MGTPRAFAGATVFNGKIMVMGGYTTQNTEDDTEDDTELGSGEVCSQ